jgi:formylmethanofuran dehydrogenase subunit C
MKGGRISIAGNAASYCGEGMLGGEIHVMGEIASISGSIKSGRIYQGETLVVGL